MNNRAFGSRIQLVTDYYGAAVLLAEIRADERQKTLIELRDAMLKEAADLEERATREHVAKGWENAFCQTWRAQAFAWRGAGDLVERRCGEARKEKDDASAEGRSDRTEDDHDDSQRRNAVGVSGEGAAVLRDVGFRSRPGNARSIGEGRPLDSVEGQARTSDDGGLGDATAERTGASSEVVHLSRTQYELLRTLRDNDRVPTGRISRLTLDALIHTELAYETDSGWICISRQGREATLLTGYTVLVPEARPISADEWNDASRKTWADEISATAPRLRAVRQASVRQLHPYGTAEHQLANRLDAAGLLRFSDRRWYVTDKGRAWLARHDRPSTQEKGTGE